MVFFNNSFGGSFVETYSEVQMSRKQVDLGSGSVKRLLFSLALPLQLHFLRMLQALPAV